MKITSSLLFVGFLLVSGCGKEGTLAQLVTGQDNETHVIDYSAPACTTGRHTFKGLSAYCAGLQDNTLNNDCGEAFRKTLFISVGCPGEFQPHRSYFAR